MPGALFTQEVDETEEPESRRRRRRKGTNGAGAQAHSLFMLQK